MCTDEEHFNPTPEERRRIQIAHEVYQRMAGFTASCITAIARPVANDEGDFIGSGSFVVFGGQTFLVTAAHVATDAQTGSLYGAAFSNGDGKRYQVVTAPILVNENIDIGIAPVTLERPPDSTRLAWPSSQVATSAGSLDDQLFVHGFPGERSRFLRMNQGINSRTLPYGATSVTPAWSGYNPDEHFAISFDPRYPEYPDGTSATLPDPAGMSGSPVWNTRRREVGEHWQPTDARLIGVIHRFDRTANCLIGSRIEHIHGLVARYIQEQQSQQSTRISHA